MNHRRAPPREIWRSSAIRNRDVWCELPDIRTRRRRTRRPFRWVVDALVVALAAAALLLISSLFFVPWLVS